jgi:putative hydrolase of the HAD superfamily
MIKGILFDYDGTLSKRYEAAYQMYRYMLHVLRPDADENSLAFETAVQRCLLWDEFGSITKDHVFSLIQKNYAPDMDIDLWKTIWMEKFAEYQKLIPGVKETLPLLKKKYKLGVLSNGDERSQKRKICSTGIDACFDAIIVTGEYGINKPDPKIFQIAAEKMALRPEEIVFVGDTFATDINGAIHAGMKPVWFLYERRGITRYPVLCVSSYEEIKHIFLEDTTWMD